MTLAHQSYAYENASSQLQARLNEPQTAQALNQILDKAELIAFAVNALDGLIQRSDKIASEAARSVADLKNSTPTQLSTLLEHLPQLIDMLPQIMAFLPQLMSLVKSPQFQRLLDVLSNPQTLEAIITLMQNMDKIAFSVKAVDGFLQRGDTIIENVGSSMRDASGAIDISKMSELLKTLPQLAETAPQLVEATTQLVPVLTSEPMQNFINSGSLERLLSSNVLAAQSIEVVGHAGSALVESYDKTQQQPQQVGIFGLLKAISDPNIQKALGFFVEFGKKFGQEI